MIKIGILSDTHGSVHPQIAELMNKCDFALHAGDIVDIKVLQKLNPKQSVVAVKGNNDAHLTSLEDIEVLELPGGKIVVEHGHKHGHEKPCHDSLRRAYPDAKAIAEPSFAVIKLLSILFVKFFSKESGIPVKNFILCFFNSFIKFLGLT